jgi:L,D-transpeptidase catalytic domain
VKPYSKLIITLLFLSASAIDVNASPPHIDLSRTQQKAQQALAFCRKHDYNIRYCILIDMGLPSGVKRFVVWDFHKNDTLLTGLISHGCGINPWSGVWSKDKPSFSNVANSHCTSLGKYRVDVRATSAWGIHVKYFLNGLDTSNSNALKRDVVLHSWEAVPDKEVYPNGTPEDWGCPAISNKTMKIVDALLRQQKKHLLLWIYN